MNIIEIENQPILSKILSNISTTNNISNAYMLYGNNREELKKYSIELAKILICTNKFDINCNKCNICSRISNNLYNELIIIDKNDEIIKKDDVIVIRDKFSTEPIEGRYNVYIINNVENMNDSSANAILKFLEEPDGRVIAIFNTTNLNKVIKTIESRCQIIKLNNLKLFNKKEEIEKFTNFSYEEIQMFFDFFCDIEKNYSLALSCIKEKVIKKYNKKSQLKSIIMTGIIFYKDILNYKIMNKFEYLEKNIETIKHIGEQSVEKLNKKISFLLKKIEELEYNLNAILFITNLLVGLGEINND